MAVGETVSVTVKRELWIILLISCYGIVALFLLLTGRLPLSSSPFLLIPLLVDQVYHVLYCPRRAVKEDRLIHTISAVGLSFVIIELFYFVNHYGLR